ncbi:MAG: hypothetical protein V1889_02855 [archaeon]
MARTFSPAEKLALLRAGGRIDTPPQTKKINEPQQTPKKEQKKKKIDFYKLARDIRKDAEKRREYARDLRDIRRQERQDRYSKTRSGKIGSGVSKFFNVAQRGLTQSLYRQGMTTEQIKELSKRFKQRQQIQLPIQIPRPVSFFDSVFNVGDMVAPMVEREIFNIASGRGEATLGDSTAFNLGREVFGHANIITNFNSPVQAVEREVWLNSNLAHVQPTRRVSNEALFWANQVP